jgi:siroheme synthase
VSGHLPPGKEGAADWDNLAAVKKSTIVILMGVAKLPLIVQHILDKVRRARLARACKRREFRARAKEPKRDDDDCYPHRSSSRRIHL